MKLEAFARNKAIQFTETCDEFPILVRVTGTQWRCRRPGIERSGQFILWAGADVVLAFNVRVNYMKPSMMMLVDMLNPNDRLSILFCGPHGVTQRIMELTYMSDHGRQVARLKINELVQRQQFDYEEYIGPVLPQAAQVYPRTVP